MIISHKWKQLMMIEILLAQKILNATVSIEGFATYHLTNNKIYPYHFSSGCCHSILRSTLVYIRSWFFSNRSNSEFVKHLVELMCYPNKILRMQLTCIFHIRYFPHQISVSLISGWWRFCIQWQSLTWN